MLQTSQVREKQSHLTSAPTTTHPLGKPTHSCYVWFAHVGSPLPATPVVLPVSLHVSSRCAAAPEQYSGSFAPSHSDPLHKVLHGEPHGPHWDLVSRFAHEAEKNEAVEPLISDSRKTNTHKHKLDVGRSWIYILPD